MAWATKRIFLITMISAALFSKAANLSLSDILKLYINHALWGCFVNIVRSLQLVIHFIVRGRLLKAVDLFLNYTGWPRKNATHTITNFKEIRDYIKLVSALMSRQFFFQQNDTKISDFGEGILILEPFFLRQCHFRNLLLLYQKVAIEVGRNFFE